MLEIKDLNVSINQKKLVDGLNLRIDKGKFVSLVGSSGSGKTLTALSIIGLLPGNAKVHGKISLDQVDFSQLSEKEMLKFRGKKVSMIFQEPMTSLNPVMRIGKQISEVLEQHTDLNSKERKDRVIEVLNEVDFPEPEIRYNSYPHQLSGGLRQRVMIAMALACDPDLLLADEPTTALDVTVQSNILKLLKKIQQERQLSILFITHDIALAANFSDEIAVIKDGTIVEKGKPAKLIEAAVDDYTVSLMEACKERESW